MVPGRVGSVDPASVGATDAAGVDAAAELDAIAPMDEAKTEWAEVDAMRDVEARADKSISEDGPNEDDCTDGSPSIALVLVEGAPLETTSDGTMGVGVVVDEKTIEFPAMVEETGALVAGTGLHTHADSNCCRSTVWLLASASTSLKAYTSDGELAISCMSWLTVRLSLVPTTTTCAPVARRPAADSCSVSSVSCASEPSITTTSGVADGRRPSAGDSMRCATKSRVWAVAVAWRSTKTSDCSC